MRPSNGGERAPVPTARTWSGGWSGAGGPPSLSPNLRLLSPCFRAPQARNLLPPSVISSPVQSLGGEEEEIGKREGKDRRDHRALARTPGGQRGLQAPLLFPLAGLRPLSCHTLSPSSLRTFWQLSFFLGWEKTKGGCQAGASCHPEEKGRGAAQLTPGSHLPGGQGQSPGLGVFLLGKLLSSLPFFYPARA